MPTGTLKRRLISKPLASKIQDDLTLKLKRPMFKKYRKTPCFGTLFTSQFLSREHKEDVKKITWGHEESVPKSRNFNAKFKKFPPRWWNAKLRAFGELSWPGFGGQVGVKLRPSCLEVDPSRLSFLVSILNLAPSSRLRQLSIRSSFVDVPGLDIK